MDAFIQIYSQVNALSCVMRQNHRFNTRLKTPDHIFLRHTGPARGFLMAFTMSLDDFIITHFVKGAGINTLSTLIYSEVRKGVRPSLYALSTIMFLAVFLLLVLANLPKKNRGGNS